MKIRIFNLFLFSLFLLGMTFLKAEAFTFTRNLKMGISGSDVIELQKILNASPDTQISTSGIGSPGQETTYFGLLTHKAVIRYQNKYYSDVLAPAGLSLGSGFVGPLTIKKLNSFSYPPSSNSVQSPSVPSAQTSIVPPQPSFPAETWIYSVMPSQVKAGDNIIIHGREFPKTGLVITMGSEKIASYSFINNNQISIIAPQKLSSGTYTFSFSHPVTKITMPQAAQSVISVKISSNPKVQPRIFSVTPQNVTENDTVTIKGSGFTKNNAIFTLMGEVTGISSSDGTTLTFKPSQLSRISTLDKVRTKIGTQQTGGIQLHVGVLNEGGFTTDAVYLMLNQ